MTFWTVDVTHFSCVYSAIHTYIPFYGIMSVLEWMLSFSFSCLIWVSCRIWRYLYYSSCHTNLPFSPFLIFKKVYNCSPICNIYIFKYFSSVVFRAGTLLEAPQGNRSVEPVLLWYLRQRLHFKEVRTRPQTGCRLFDELPKIGGFLDKQQSLEGIEY